MAKMQIRIDRDIQSCLALSAKHESRSIVAHANHLLRSHFAANPPPPVKQAQELSPLRIASVASRAK